MNHIKTNTTIIKQEEREYTFDDLCCGCFFICGEFLFYKYYDDKYNAIKIKTAEKYMMRGSTPVIPVDVEIKTINH